MQNWMRRSQQTLEQWFAPDTARGLDAFIEGMTLHFVTDRAPLSEGGNPHDGRAAGGERAQEEGAEAAFHPEWLNAGNKNPSTLNRSGGVDGLHKMGTSKKSSGITYDLMP